MTNTLPTIEINSDELDALMRDAYELGRQHALEMRDLGASTDALFTKAEMASEIASEITNRTVENTGVQYVEVQFGGRGFTYLYKSDLPQLLNVGDKVYVDTSTNPLAKARVVAIADFTQTQVPPDLRNVVSLRD